MNITILIIFCVIAANYFAESYFKRNPLARKKMIFKIYAFVSITFLICLTISMFPKSLEALSIFYFTILVLITSVTIYYKFGKIKHI